jgi:hypothetical protein
MGDDANPFAAVATAAHELRDAWESVHRAATQAHKEVEALVERRVASARSDANAWRTAFGADGVFSSRDPMLHVPHWDLGDDAVPAWDAVRAKTAAFSSVAAATGTKGLVLHGTTVLRVRTVNHTACCSDEFDDGWEDWRTEDAEVAMVQVVLARTAAHGDSGDQLLCKISENELPCTAGGELKKESGDDDDGSELRRIGRALSRSAWARNAHATKRTVDEWREASSGAPMRDTISGDSEMMHGWLTLIVPWVATWFLGPDVHDAEVAFEEWLARNGEAAPAAAGDAGGGAAPVKRCRLEAQS